MRAVQRLFFSGVFVWLEHSGLSLSQPKTPVRTIRKPSAVAPDIFLDTQCALVANARAVNLGSHLFYTNPK